MLYDVDLQVVEHHFAIVDSAPCRCQPAERANAGLVRQRLTSASPGEAIERAAGGILCREGCAMRQTGLSLIKAARATTRRRRGLAWSPAPGRCSEPQRRYLSDAQLLPRQPVPSRHWAIDQIRVCGRRLCGLRPWVLLDHRSCVPIPIGSPSVRPGAVAGAIYGELGLR